MAADPFTVVVAPDAAGNAVGEIYLDDGASFHHERGAFTRRALTFKAHGELRCSVPVAASAAAGGVEGTGAAPAGSGGGFPASAATVERVVILGAQRYGAAAVKGAALEVVPAPASTREGMPAAATAVRKPDVPMAHDWTITLEAK